VKNLYLLFPTIFLVISLLLNKYLNIPFYDKTLTIYGFKYYGLISINFMVGILFLYRYAWKEEGLTDNVIANRLANPFIFVITSTIFFYEYNKTVTESLINSGILILVYNFYSTYFQPDLDQKNIRGEKTFPLGFLLPLKSTTVFLNTTMFKGMNKQYMQFIYSMQTGFNFIKLPTLWKKIWSPFAELLTHRGVNHWPLIGLWLRVYYIILCIFPFLYIFDLYFKIPIFTSVYNVLEGFLPTYDNIFSEKWLIYYFPAYLGDIIHIFVDYIDSRRKGIPFCPTGIPRGKIMQLIKKK
jgi:uncharacterized metal-binding protein